MLLKKNGKWRKALALAIISVLMASYAGIGALAEEGRLENNDNENHIEDTTGGGDTITPNDTTDLNNPSEPANPNEPNNPNEPGNPNEPNNPNEPGNPNEPNNPNEPVNPNEPNNPNEPGNPNEPSNPNEPGNPNEPNNTNEPGNSNEPNEPGESAIGGAYAAMGGAELSGLSIGIEPFSSSDEGTLVIRKTTIGLEGNYRAFSFYRKKQGSSSTTTHTISANEFAKSANNDTASITIKDLKTGTYTLTEQVSSVTNVAGHKLTGITANGVTQPLDGSSGYSFTISKNKTTEVHFINYYGGYNSVVYSYEGAVPTDAPALPETVKYAQGDTVTVANTPGSALAYWSFMGWETADASISHGKFTMPDKDVHITGRWSYEPITYNVYYDGNGADEGEVEDNNVYESGGGVTVLPNRFLRKGHVFTQWNTEPDGTGTAYDKDDTFKMPAHDVTLYAQWQETEKFRVYYDGNGADEGTVEDLSVYEEGGEATVLPNGFLRDKYEFIGWNTEPNGFGTGYTEDDTFAMPAHDVILYAQWNMTWVPEFPPVYLSVEKKVMDADGSWVDAASYSTDKLEARFLITVSLDTSDFEQYYAENFSDSPYVFVGGRLADLLNGTDFPLGSNTHFELYLSEDESKPEHSFEITAELPEGRHVNAVAIENEWIEAPTTLVVANLSDEATVTVSNPKKPVVYVSVLKEVAFEGGANWNRSLSRTTAGATNVYYRITVTKSGAVEYPVSGSLTDMLDGAPLALNDTTFTIPAGETSFTTYSPIVTLPAGAATHTNVVTISGTEAVGEFEIAPEIITEPETSSASVVITLPSGGGGGTTGGGGGTAGGGGTTAVTAAAPVPVSEPETLEIAPDEIPLAEFPEQPEEQEETIEETIDEETVIIEEQEIPLGEAAELPDLPKTGASGSSALLGLVGLLLTLGGALVTGKES